MAEQQIIQILDSLAIFMRNQQFDQALEHYDTTVEVDATAWGATGVVTRPRESIIDRFRVTATAFDETHFEITNHKVAINGNEAQAASNVTGRYRQGNNEFSFVGINHTTFGLKNNRWVITRTRTQVTSTTGNGAFVLAATQAALQKNQK